jgi:hypothetical protein
MKEERIHLSIADPKLGFEVELAGMSGLIGLPNRYRITSLGAIAARMVREMVAAGAKRTGFRVPYRGIRKPPAFRRHGMRLQVLVVGLL